MFCCSWQLVFVDVLCRVIIMLRVSEIPNNKTTTGKLSIRINHVKLNLIFYKILSHCLGFYVQQWQN